MFNVKLSVATAILILVAINSVFVGYLTSKVTYSANLAEKNLAQNTALLQQTLKLANSSEHVEKQNKAILINQINAVMHKINVTTDAQRRASVSLLNEMQDLQNFFVAQQKQQSAQIQGMQPGLPNAAIHPDAARTNATK